MPLLPAGFRHLRPVLPLDSHRRPMRPGADTTLLGQIGIVADFLGALDLRDVTLIVSDWGGPLFLPALGRDGRVGSLVVLPCEAFDNFPPGLPGRLVAAAAHVPGGLRIAARQLRGPRRMVTAGRRGPRCLYLRSGLGSSQPRLEHQAHGDDLRRKAETSIEA